MTEKNHLANIASDVRDIRNLLETPVDSGDLLTAILEVVQDIRGLLNEVSDSKPEPEADQPFNELSSPTLGLYTQDNRWYYAHKGPTYNGRICRKTSTEGGAWMVYEQGTKKLWGERSYICRAVVHTTTEHRNL